MLRIIFANAALQHIKSDMLIMKNVEKSSMIVLCYGTAWLSSHFSCKHSGLLNHLLPPVIEIATSDLWAAADLPYVVSSTTLFPNTLLKGSFSGFKGKRKPTTTYKRKEPEAVVRRLSREEPHKRKRVFQSGP